MPPKNSYTADDLWNGFCWRQTVMMLFCNWLVFVVIVSSALSGLGSEAPIKVSGLSGRKEISYINAADVKLSRLDAVSYRWSAVLLCSLLYDLLYWPFLFIKLFAKCLICMEFYILFVLFIFQNRSCLSMVNDLFIFLNVENPYDILYVFNVVDTGSFERFFIIFQQLLIVEFLNDWILGNYWCADFHRFSMWLIILLAVI